MSKAEQLRTAIEEDAERRRARDARRLHLLEGDEQRAAALRRWEKTLGGKDVHTHLAELLTDDDQHPVSTTQVHDWIARRNGRRPPAEGDDLIAEADEIFNAWRNQRGGYTVPEKVRALTPEQENALLKQKLLEFGTAGEQKLREVRAAKPPPSPAPDWEATTPGARTVTR